MSKLLFTYPHWIKNLMLVFRILSRYWYRTFSQSYSWAYHTYRFFKPCLGQFTANRPKVPVFHAVSQHSYNYSIYTFALASEGMAIRNPRSRTFLAARGTKIGDDLFLFFRGHPSCWCNLTQNAPGIVVSFKKKKVDTWIATAECAPRSYPCQLSPIVILYSSVQFFNHRNMVSLLIEQLHRLIHIGKWTKLFRQVTLQFKYPMWKQRIFRASASTSLLVGQKNVLCMGISPEICFEEYVKYCT